MRLSSTAAPTPIQGGGNASRSGLRRWFQFVFGLKAARFKRYYWLDVVALAGNLLKADQALVATHYFTARIRDNGRNGPDQKRQNQYWRPCSIKGQIASTGIIWRNHAGAAAVAQPGRTTKRK
jgi:hypothetical protein